MDGTEGNMVEVGKPYENVIIEGQYANPCMIDREEAIELLEQALSRLEADKEDNPHDNGLGRHTKRRMLGGAYWRLARVLTGYVDPRMDSAEGTHASFVRGVHGVMSNYRPIDEENS